MDREDFPKFFAAVNSGHSPFAWQERLLDTVLECGRWPDRIAAPTGAGKTSAIDVHVFAVALTAANGGPRLPRRLAMVVGRRVLVDDQYERARALAQALMEPGDDLLTEIAGTLSTLRWPGGAPRLDDTGQDSPLVTARLRGGSIPSRAWRDYPSACAVLCATPDMWGSRLLFGGYGVSDLAAPREAGMLAFDAVVLVDEAHLSRQLLVTARQVSRLATAAEAPITGIPALQVAEVSATPAPTVAARPGPAPVAVGVGTADLDDEALAARLTRPKPVSPLPVKDWPPTRRPGKVADAIADAVTSMICAPSEDDVAAHTVGCFVNTVPMAVAVADALRSRAIGERPLRTVMVCGQIRPADLERLTDRYPGLLSPEGNHEIDVIVSTQSLEVGADLDLAGVVTELAAGSALAQRAGRANRRGKRPHAPIAVIVPAEPLADRARSGPYDHEELEAALSWVAGRAADPDGLAPWSLQEHPPPPARTRRTLYQRPELADAWHWARTSDDLAAEPELSLWLSESLEEETSVGIAVRDALPEDPSDTVELVRDLPPQPREVFPVPYRTALAVLAAELTRPHADERSDGPLPIRVRGEDVSPLRSRTRLDGTQAPDVRPGDLIVVDSSSAIFTRRGEEGVFSPQVVVSATDADADGVEPPQHAPADDVLHSRRTWPPGEVILRLEASPGLARVAGVDSEVARRVLGHFADGFSGLTERERRDQLADLLEEERERLAADVPGLVNAVITLLRGQVKHSDVTLRRTDEQAMRLMVVDRRRAVADEDVRQVFTPRGEQAEPVFLSDHQSDVAARAVLLGERLCLPGELVNALRFAGEHHDDGKADQRFQQVRLGAAPGSPLLAKSNPPTTVRQVHERQAQAGLPLRWRHEQRSVVDCWDAAQSAPGLDPLLAVRLAGTSHGHGRSGFPHTAQDLADEGALPQWLSRAASLFDKGGWDSLIEQTQIRYGVWGCAYLEALLRGADSQISGEGG